MVDKWVGPGPCVSFFATGPAPQFLVSAYYVLSLYCSLLVLSAVKKVKPILVLTCIVIFFKVEVPHASIGFLVHWDTGHIN